MVKSDPNAPVINVMEVIKITPEQKKRIHEQYLLSHYGKNYRIVSNWYNSEVHRIQKKGLLWGWNWITEFAGMSKYTKDFSSFDEARKYLIEELELEDRIFKSKGPWVQVFPEVEEK